MDYTQLIETAHQYVKSGSDLPSYREHLIRIVRAAIAEIAGSSEQKQALTVLEEELSVRRPAVDSFPGSCARSW
jgi:hypothetical protein